MSSSRWWATNQRLPGLRRKQLDVDGKEILSVTMVTSTKGKFTIKNKKKSEKSLFFTVMFFCPPKYITARRITICPTAHLPHRRNPHPPPARRFRWILVQLTTITSTTSSTLARLNPATSQCREWIPPPATALSGYEKKAIEKEKLPLTPKKRESKKKVG